MHHRGYFYIHDIETSDELSKAQKRRHLKPLSFALSVILFILMRMIYGYRVCPVLPVGDTGELATAAWTNGVAHPPGYPLFTILGRYFVGLRFHSPLDTFEPGTFDAAFRMNMLSLWLGAVTVLVVYFILARAFKNPFVAFVGAFIFGISKTFLSQCLVGEVYTLHALLVALIIYVILLIDEKPTSWRLCILALLFGLGLSNHTSILLLVIPTLILIFLAIKAKSLRIRKNLLIFMLVFFVIGLLPYLYLPSASRSDPYLDWGNPENIVNFFKVVTRSEFRQIKESIQYTEDSLGYMGISRAFNGWLKESFGRLFILFGYIGLLIALARAKRFGLFLALSYFFMTVPYFIYFRSISEPDLFYLEVYYISAYIVFAIFIGFTIFAAVEYLPRIFGKSNLKSLVSFLIFIFFAIYTCVFWFGHTSKYSMRDHTIGSRYAYEILRDIPFNAILITSEDEIFLFWYLQQVANFRADVVVLENNTLLMTDKWLWESTKKQHPDVLVPERELLPSDNKMENFLYQLRNLNPNRQIYFTSLLAEFDPGIINFTLVPDGLLYVFGRKTDFNTAILTNTSLANGLNASPLDFAKTNLDPYEEMLLERFTYAFFNYGNYYLAKRSFAKANENLLKAFKLDPEFHPEGFLPVAGILAQSMIDNGNPDGAAEILAQLVNSGKADSAWYHLYAKVLLMQGKVEEAVNVLKDGLIRDPQNQFLQSLLHEILEPPSASPPQDDSEGVDDSSNVDV